MPLRSYANFSTAVFEKAYREMDLSPLEKEDISLLCEFRDSQTFRKTGIGAPAICASSPMNYGITCALDSLIFGTGRFNGILISGMWEERRFVPPNKSYDRHSPR